jgi:hypothetical protein
MPLALIAVAAIAAGITLVLADDRVGRISPRGPETGAVQARVMGAHPAGGRRADLPQLGVLTPSSSFL